MRPHRLPPVATAAAVVVISLGAIVAAAVSVPLQAPPARPTLTQTPASTLTATPVPGSASTIPDAVRGIPPALVTSTGVPVVVIGRTADGRFVVTTPCGRQATVTGGTPLYGAAVAIDPGHGGSIDTGAVHNGIIERDLNMAVADALAAVLRRSGVSVVLTRTSNYGAILPMRAALADALGAKLMVSIHHNASPAQPPTSSEPGTEVFVQASAASRRLGGLLYESASAALSAAYSVTWYHLPDAGVLRVTQRDGQDTYGMIRHPRTTTALIELGWLSNPDEANLVYKTPSYVPIAAEALADAVRQYLAGAPSSVDVGNRTFTAQPARGTSDCTDPELQE